MRALPDDLSLADLLTAASRLRRTLTLDLRTPEGTGRIYVSMGDIVHASYGELLGREAIDAFLDAPELEYSALPDERALFGLRAALERESPLPPPSSNPRRTMESPDFVRGVAGRSTPPPLLPLPILPRIPPPPPPPSASRVTAIVHPPSSPWHRATTGRPRWMTVLGVVGSSVVLGIGTGLALDWLSSAPAPAAAATALPPSVPPRATAAPVAAPPAIVRDVPPCAPPAASAELVERLVFRPQSTFLDPPAVAKVRALSATLKQAGHRALIVGHAGQSVAPKANERLAAVRAGLVADELRQLGVPRGLYDVAAVVPAPATASPTAPLGDDAGGFVEVRLTELALATAPGGSRSVE